MRHPLNNGDSRAMVAEFVHKIGDILVKQKILTPAMRDMTENSIDEDYPYPSETTDGGGQECGDCTFKDRCSHPHTKNPPLKTGQEMAYHG